MLGLLLAAALAAVSGHIDYQLVIEAKNAPSGALDKIGADSLLFTGSFLSLLPGYRLLAPGESERRRAQNLRGAVEDMPLLGKGETGHRGLGVLNTCPASCLTTSTKKCRNLGCYAADSRRELLLTNVLSCTSTLLQESVVNLQLAPYCGLNLFCSIKAKMMMVQDNGTTVPAC